MKKILYFLFIIFLVASCVSNVKNKYTRIWKINMPLDNSSSDRILRDTVNNSFSTIHNLTRRDIVFFETCFNNPLAKWVQPKYSNGFYKNLFSKKVTYKQDSLTMIYCIFSLDSNREDHIISFLVLEKVGIIYESNPEKKGNYMLEKMVDNKSKKEIIVPGYVKSIYPALPFVLPPEVGNHH